MRLRSRRETDLSALHRAGNIRMEDERIGCAHTPRSVLVLVRCRIAAHRLAPETPCGEHMLRGVPSIVADCDLFKQQFVIRLIILPCAPSADLRRDTLPPSVVVRRIMRIHTPFLLCGAKIPRPFQPALRRRDIRHTAEIPRNPRSIHIALNRDAELMRRFRFTRKVISRLRCRYRIIHHRGMQPLKPPFGKNLIADA